VPALVSRFVPQLRLSIFPGGKRAAELITPSFVQTEQPFSPILTMALCDPSLPGHDSQRACQGRTIHGKDLAQLTLGYFSYSR